MPPKIATLSKASARRILESSISRGLREVVGPAGLKLVSMELPVEKAAEDPRKFHEVLVSIFMPRGALLIEREIARRLLDRLGKMDGNPGTEGLAEPEIQRRHQVELLREFAKAAGLSGSPSVLSGSLADGYVAQVLAAGP